MQEKNFVSFEYKTVTVKSEDQTKAMDMYEAFGWEVTGTNTSIVDGTTLSLKRDRKQRHKQELTKLERDAENVFDTIKTLQKAKTLGGNIFSYTFGIISILIFGGGMSLVMLNSDSIPALIGGIVLDIVGLGLSTINYFIYKKIVAKKTKKILPVIDDNEEKLANILEKGNDLLRSDLI